MQSKTLHRWTLLGVCVATAAVVGPACNRDRPTMPRAESGHQGVVNTPQPAPPGTGGSGTNVPTDAKGTPTQPQPSGAQGLSNQIGAPGYTAPNENTKDPGGARPFIQGHEAQQR